MDKVIVVTTQSALRAARDGDVDYWLARPAAERIAAVETLRRWTSKRLNRDFEEFVGLLDDGGVENLAGGHALAVHGRPRYTGDLDLGVGDEPADILSRLAALDAFGFASPGLKAADFLPADAVVQLGYAPGRIDLLTGIVGVEFTACFAHRQTVSTGGRRSAHHPHRRLQSQQARCRTPAGLDRPRQPAESRRQIERPARRFSNASTKVFATSKPVCCVIS